MNKAIASKATGVKTGERKTSALTRRHVQIAYFHTSIAVRESLASMAHNATIKIA